ncbi:MAG: UDP-3-O-(3-hydroxymyristoyl)glucosamine N-acyltransferase [Bacteroidota bacterium]
MEFSAEQISELLGGQIEGNPEIVINKVSKIENGSPNSISFLANPKYTPYIYSTNASIVIVNKNFVPEQPINATLIRVDDPYQCFAKLLNTYDKEKQNKTGIERSSYISKKAQLGKNVYIGAFAYVADNVIIGDNVKLYPHVYVGDNVEIKSGTVLYAGAKVCPGCKIGANCTIHMGVIIGGDGFGFTLQCDNDYQKVAQIGNVVIEDNVEIGANTAIDRATLGSTIIKKGVKLDNLIQIAHNVEIGENTVIAAQTGIAGSTKIGRDCMIGGQVGIVGHITIADKVKIAAQSGISSNLKEGEIVQGSPSFYIGDYKRAYVLFRRLPELQNRIKELEKELRKLKQPAL